MASQTICYTTLLPQEVVDILEKDLSKEYDPAIQPSSVGYGQGGAVDTRIRNSKNAWISSQHWIAGFIWHYVSKANRDNFLYDLTCIDGENLQYTVYNEGEYYGWHTDENYESWYKPLAKSNKETKEILVHDYLEKNTETIRKLSFSLLLSDPDTYEGGNFQLMSGVQKSYIAPRQKGVLVIFDSRTQHRVQKVTKGVRKSIVGWCVGPRWK
jgi:Rps23 Pro-64 3,4-dihydroxylase Tpa1-like proline 4-hydroxylase